MKVSKKAVIVITSNRGLAGGYNSNIVKLVTGERGSHDRECRKSTPSVIKEETHWSERAMRSQQIISDVIDESASYDDAAELCKQSFKSHIRTDEIGEIYLAYTHFKNTGEP